MTQEQAWQERFYELYQEDPKMKRTGLIDYFKARTFIQSEIDLALAKRDKEIVEMIEELFLCNHMIYEKNKNVKEIENDIVNLITKNK